MRIQFELLLMSVQNSKLRVSPASLLKKEAEQLIECIKNNLSLNTIKKIIAIAAQIHSLNPTLANEIMLKLVQSIQYAVKRVMASQSIQQAKAYQSCLSECMVILPSFRLSIQRFKTELSQWINQEQGQPAKSTTQSQSGVRAQSFSVNYGGAYDTKFNPVVPNDQQAKRPHPGKPILVGGIFIQPYLELVSE